jgi:uncharacterized membrane protein
MRAKPKRSWWAGYLRRFTFLGVIVGAIGVYCSFLPSLLPRGWILQGVLSGIIFAIGYGIGVFLSLVIREFRPNEPDAVTKSKIRRYVYIGLGILYMVFLLLGMYWQKQADALVGMPPNNAVSAVGTTLVFVIMVMLLMVLARSIVSLFRWLRRQILRVIPVRLAYVLALTLTVMLVVGFINGVIFEAARGVVNEAFGLRNGQTEAGAAKPAAAELSGSPQSLIRWESLGQQGRTFISGGQKTVAISDFTGLPAEQPVRVYAGLESAGSGEDRAELAVRDLKRAGGFDRQVLVVATTTGTGWVDEQGVEGLEYMYGGDTAMVSMQYSYLPSWLSFLVDQSKAQEAGIELYNAVLAEWQELPPAERPKLVIFGESLGSFGGESAFTGWSAFRATADGAVWAGPPNFNHLWSKTTADRDAGSPEILPVVDKGEVVRYATESQDLTDLPLQDWQSPRAVYLQNPSDPIVWWSPKLLFSQSDWLTETRGKDVSPATRWIPIVTFWQVTGDMVFSTGVPDNHGHKYGTLPTEAWAQVIPPEGWTAERTDELRELLSKRGD